MTNYTNRPVPGYYKRRFVRGGPWVPVEIRNPPDPVTGEEMDRSWTDRLEAYTNGLPSELYDTWISSCGNPITKEEFDRMKPSTEPLKPSNWKSDKPIF